MADRNYPLPGGEGDPRFTIGVTIDIARILEGAGYPELTGVDQYALMGHLFRFLYVGEEARA
ncbi:hypothetical protein [Nonomuraea sp. NPDC001023]|uniref:hypothetical protein n=1 Tax=unclassified Nonomuraea TaxID=2593643 RepID=UPI00332CA766